MDAHDHEFVTLGKLSRSKGDIGRPIYWCRLCGELLLQVSADTVKTATSKLTENWLSRKGEGLFRYSEVEAEWKYPVRRLPEQKGGTGKVVALDHFRKLKTK